MFAGLRAQNSAFHLAFDNGANKSNSLSVGCGRPSNISNKCYHARTDPIDVQQQDEANAVDLCEAFL